MKKIYTLLCLLFIIAPDQGQAQCLGGTNTGSITPTTTWQIVTLRAGRNRNFVGTAGVIYQFSFCSGGGSTTINAELSINDATGMINYAYNAFACGSAGSLTWVCPANATYQILVTEWICGNAPTNSDLAYRIQPPPGPGVSCANPYIIPSLPFTGTNFSTCGYGNPYDNTDACGSWYMNGEDFIFRLTVATPMTINVALTGTLNWTGVFVMNGCPTAGGTSCIAANIASSCSGSSTPNESSSGNPVADFTLPSAGTYFILVSTFPAPNCTDFNIAVTQTASSGGPGLGCYSVSSPAYAPDGFNTGTQLSFPDDEFSNIVPLPFPFCFMGTYYNDVIVSSNSTISFDATCAGLYSSYSTVAIPSTTPTDIRNTIMGPWHDIDPSVTGTIRYNTYGTAPNRRFVVSWNNVAMFSIACNAQRFTGQITLYETSNIIDNFINQKPVCASWNNGDAVQGLHDRTGTVAVPVAGRNNTNWTASNDARRFTPTCAPCFAALPVSFMRIMGRPVGSQNVVNWEVANESQGRRFVLERSRNGTNFEAVGEIPGTNSSEPRSYEMMDEMPFSPVTWYRVRHDDLNGVSSYTEVINVVSGAAGFIFENAWIQPTQNLIDVDIFSAHEGVPVAIEIMDAQGRSLVRENVNTVAGTNQFRIDVGEIGAGIYFVNVSAEGFKESRRVMKF
jgi:Secretion system C-terminal sorting domain